MVSAPPRENIRAPRAFFIKKRGGGLISFEKKTPPPLPQNIRGGDFFLPRRWFSRKTSKRFYRDFGPPKRRKRENMGKRIIFSPLEK